MAYSSNMIDFDHLLSEEDPSFRLLMEQPETVNTDLMLNSDALNLEHDKISFLNNSSEKNMNSNP